MENLIEKHYKHYLDKVKLKEEDMLPIQQVETRRAFVAGMSEMFVAMMTGLGIGVRLDDYKRELENFWKNESKKS